eukprot:TRINITY_DN6806_c0_g1_i3.p1 TRINITY_DN6806_c0_g1~~TRINITY_DN6806_c0_g1_i3.p1  ORF type:complete len:164 (+),score=34.30 TRINITY_DN6806_c0_g1_i3:62-553(+)
MCIRDSLRSTKNENLEAFSRHFGYINLMPLMFGYIEANSAEFNATLGMMVDPKQLWSQFGLRSISRTSWFYRRDSDYWRGRIWINMNFLVLRGLKKYYWTNPSAQDAYEKLRKNIIETVCGKNLRQFGYIFEHYDPESGAGNGNRPFTGWSALISLIISENYE